MRRYFNAERNIGGNPYQIFVGQVTAIYVYCWIRKGAILCAEQLILGVETSRYIDSFVLEIIFDPGMFVIDLNGLKSNLTSALSFSDMLSCV